jgi:hypothetical protein
VPGAIVQVATPRTSDGATNIPRGELRYARELANAATPLTAAFVNAPATPFTIQSATLGRNAAIGSVGILGAVCARLDLSACALTHWLSSFEPSLIGR